jgi:hypothetical protein
VISRISFLSALAFLALFTPALNASLPNLVLVDETFDSYVDQTAFETVWQPRNPITVPPGAPPYGLLLPDNSALVPPPNDFPPGMQGKAVFIKDALNVYAGPAQAELEFLSPTPTHAIKLTGDMFDDGLLSKRTTMGLRFSPAGSGPPLNIIELGRFNANAQDPTDPAPIPPANQPALGFAYRIIQFGPFGPPLVRQPNWQYFPLDPALDGPDADSLVRPNDIGPGWHRYSAEIGVDFVTMTLDLFRDGLNNATHSPGVDSSVTWSILTVGAPLNRLQIGGPSGLTSAFGSVVDNIRLERVELTIPEPSAGALLAIGMLAVSRRRG